MKSVETGRTMKNKELRVLERATSNNNTESHHSMHRLAINECFNKFYDFFDAPLMTSHSPAIVCLFNVQ